VRRAAQAPSRLGNDAAWRAGRRQAGDRLARQPMQRCWKRQAPVDARSVHSRSRSGGLSDSMNQRAVSAP
jgi:hypothetical protein